MRSSTMAKAASIDMTRTSVDATGPLTANKTLLYRVNASFNRKNSFRDFVFDQDAFVAPMLTWRPNEHFRFTLDAEYQNSIFVADADSAIPAIGSRPAAIPISRYLQNPAVTRANPSRLERGMIGYDWTLDFDENWSLTNRFAYTDIQWAQRITNTYLVVEPTGDVGRYIWDVNAHRYQLATNVDLKGRFETGPFKLATLVGFDYFDETRQDFGVNGVPTDPINIYAPSHLLSGYQKGPNNFYFPVKQSWKGVYAQDMISFLDDRVHLLLGGRHDWSSSAFGYSPFSFAQAYSPLDPNLGVGFVSADDHAWSPRVGLVLQPMPWLSFYANYVRSFGVTNALPLPGSTPFAPERGLQWEGGVKAELLDGRLIATLAYYDITNYDITKSGVVQSIPGTRFSEPVGLVHSNGVAGGQLGNQLQNAPRHSGALWAKYEAQGDWKGLELGAGVTAVGLRQGNNDNSFQLPAYARVDTLISYRLPEYLTPWTKAATVQLNVKNLLDSTYYRNSYDRFSIAPGAPRTFLLSLRAEF